MTGEDLRRYQSTRVLRRTQRALYVFYACMVVFIISMTWSEQGSFPVGIAAFLVVGIVAIFLFFRRKLERVGLEERAGGYAYHDDFGRVTEFPFSCVDRFEARRYPLRRGTPAVYLVCTSGFSVQVLGLVQGSLTEWNGGETRDIVGVLNQRHAARAARRHGA